MRLDHISYVASHDQISDVVNRIGSQIGTAFVDGGIHPKFGTRNFTAPLLNGQYIEVVCPLDHPATDATPFGKAVKKKADTGGGWLTWVFRTNNIKRFEDIFGRKAVEGVRIKPDGAKLTWKQIGVRGLQDSNGQPFFIEWLSDNHPSANGNPKAKLIKVIIEGIENLELNLFNKITKSLEEDCIVVEKSQEKFSSGIESVVFQIKDTLMEIY
jgi:hypothetical protein